jgi:hypothetical protein
MEKTFMEREIWETSTEEMYEESRDSARSFHYSVGLRALPGSWWAMAIRICIQALRSVLV